MLRVRTVYDKSIPQIGLAFVIRLHGQAPRFYISGRVGDPICQHYHWFLSRGCRPGESSQKQKVFLHSPLLKAGVAFTFSLVLWDETEKVSKKSSALSE
jgi:hypothetical protein